MQTRNITLKYDDYPEYVLDCNQVRKHMQRVMANRPDFSFSGNNSIFADLDLGAMLLRRCLIVDMKMLVSDPVSDAFSAEIVLTARFDI